MKQLEPGSVVLGRYRIVRSLGAGGMGVVYLAERTAGGTKVVIKTVHDHLAHDPEMRARFLREAEATRALRHASIVDVVEASADPLLMVLEHLPGQSLQQRLREGPLSESEVIAIATQLLDALDAAHERQLIHRDIKPANVMVLDRTRVKLLDFGISRMVDEARHTKLTQTGQIIGTPGYLAPEQALARPVDARTDLYSLGVLMYRAVAGRLPFEGKAAGLLRAVVQDEPYPLPTLKPGVDPGLASVVHRALQKNPSHRFQSAREMREALAPKRSKWLFVALLAGVATALLTVGMMTMLDRDTVSESRAALAPVQPILTEVVTAELDAVASDAGLANDTSLGDANTSVDTSAGTDMTTLRAARAVPEPPSNVFAPRPSGLSVRFQSDRRRDVARWFEKVREPVERCFDGRTSPTVTIRAAITFNQTGRASDVHVRGAGSRSTCLTRAIRSGRDHHVASLSTELRLSWRPAAPRARTTGAMETMAPGVGRFLVEFPVRHRMPLQAWWHQHQVRLMGCFHVVREDVGFRTWTVNFDSSGAVSALSAGGANYSVTSCALNAVRIGRASPALHGTEVAFRVRWIPP